jgi:hypothetical protein
VQIKIKILNVSISTRATSFFKHPFIFILSLFEIPKEHKTDPIVPGFFFRNVVEGFAG